MQNESTAKGYAHGPNRAIVERIAELNKEREAEVNRIRERIVSLTETQQTMLQNGETEKANLVGKKIQQLNDVLTGVASAENNSLLPIDQAIVENEAKLGSYFYEVEIPANDGTNYFEYGAEQPVSVLERIRDAASKHEEAEYKMVADMIQKHIDNGDSTLSLLNEIANELGVPFSSKKVSELLSEAGFVGTKVNDVAYVVYNVDDAKITSVVDLNDNEGNGISNASPAPKSEQELDAEYMEAVENGDMEKAQELVRNRIQESFFEDEVKRNISKIETSKDAVITGNEIPEDGDFRLYKKNALEYGKSIRGTYVNNDTKEEILLSGGNKRGGLREILQHDIKDRYHLQSIAAIPQIIENSIFVRELPNNDKKKYPTVSKYRYYVCGLKIGGKDFTVKSVIAVQNNGDRYYDHSLTDIEKGKLLSIIPSIQKEGIEVCLPNFIRKDRRLISILQTNRSKIVSKNGNLLQVEHSSPEEIDVFDINKLGSNSGDRGLYGNGFYFGDVGETSIYGKNTNHYYLNIKNPFEIEDYPEDMAKYISDNFDKAGLRELQINDGVRTFTLGDYIDAVRKTDEEISSGKYNSEIEEQRAIYGKYATEEVRKSHIIEKSGSIPGSIRSLINDYVVGGSDAFTEALKKERHDGVIADKGNNSHEYVAFYPNQIKLSNPVTYDDSNKIIPLSKRGDVANESTRFMSGQESTPDSSTAFEREKEIQNTANTLNTPVTVIHSEEELDALEGMSDADKAKMKREGMAYYDANTGQVIAYLPHIGNTEDAVMAVLHEVVGHKGLRGLFGKEEFDSAMRALFNSLPQSIKAEVVSLANRSYNGDTIVAMDEYLSQRAQKDETPTWWQKVKAAIKGLIREKFGLDIEVSDNDIKYLLWQSKNQLRKGDTLGEAAQRVMRNRLGINIFNGTENDPNTPDGGPSGTTRNSGSRFMTINQATESDDVKRYFDNILNSARLRTKESMADFLAPVKAFQDLAEKVSGKPIRDSQDVDRIMASLSSKDAAQGKYFDGRFGWRLGRAIAKIVGNDSNWKRESKGKAYYLNRYAAAKHGIERNRDMV